MALVSSGISILGRQTVLNLTTGNVTYFLRLSDYPQTFVAYAGFYYLERQSVPLQDWVQVRGVPLWVKNTEIGIATPTGNNYRYAVAWRREGVPWEVHNYV